MGIKHVLITNDDGVHRLGLKVLADAASEVFSRVTVVAPSSEMSGVSHGITLTKPMRSRQHDNGYFSVDGTPADCIITALGYMCAEDPPDLVLSGINHGPNLGHDVFYSGTVAGAREGLIKGIPSVAFSLARGHERGFENLGPLMRLLLRHIADQGLPEETMLNINIPVPNAEADYTWGGVQGIRGLRVTSLGHRTYSDEILRREDPRGNEYFWIGGAMPVLTHIDGTDCGAILDGYVSVTPIDLNVTRQDVMDDLASFKDLEA